MFALIGSTCPLLSNGEKGILNHKLNSSIPLELNEAQHFFRHSFQVSHSKSLDGRLQRDLQLRQLQQGRLQRPGRAFARPRILFIVDEEARADRRRSSNLRGVGGASGGATQERCPRIRSDAHSSLVAFVDSGRQQSKGTIPLHEDQTEADDRRVSKRVVSVSRSVFVSVRS